MSLSKMSTHFCEDAHTIKHPYTCMKTYSVLERLQWNHEGDVKLCEIVLHAREFQTTVYFVSLPCILIFNMNIVPRTIKLTRKSEQCSNTRLISDYVTFFSSSELSLVSLLSSSLSSSFVVCDEDLTGIISDSCLMDFLRMSMSQTMCTLSLWRILHNTARARTSSSMRVRSLRCDSLLTTATRYTRMTMIQLFLKR